LTIKSQTNIISLQLYKYSISIVGICEEECSKYEMTNDKN
jgi:hypothetical protein